MRWIDTIEALEALYAPGPAPGARLKETNRLTPHYRALIEASPFMVLATAGPEGLDCSPRGDAPGFARIADDSTVIIPDRRGNNRIDSLRNIVSDPRVAMLFLIPGSGTTLRLNGVASISAEPDLLNSFAVDGKAPRTALVVSVRAVYFQCSRAILRSHLWDSSHHVDVDTLPTAGAILAGLTANEIGGDAYDAEWPSRAVKSLW
jgi:hypothetical protein